MRWPSSPHLARKREKGGKRKSLGQLHTFGGLFAPATRQKDWKEQGPVPHQNAQSVPISA